MPRTMADSEKARARMAQEQLRRRGISDTRVLDAMTRAERHRFVDPSYADRAYDDMPLPIPGGQTISQPYMVALMTQTAGLKGNERVLEVGSGSGYQTAILAELAAEVYSVERIAELCDQARALLFELGYRNCFLRVGDGAEGWPEKAPFDVVLVTAAMPGIPRPLLEQLSVGGRLVAPIGEEELQSLVRISRDEHGWHEEYFGECRFVKLVGRHGFAPE
jgi:protein-L-isoaspartate(D-aspartate) O-methyltransferase